ncbi:phosphatase PAP2 family protein [Ignavibacterium album]|uniref:phosphatase PAP2 family protein n=1 Tax=Ignavibacterium album TaxID=591197 RepID=UPI0026ED152E|nr:phosphatase PAP2 family protein [Ignavibacterium album]
MKNKFARFISTIFVPPSFTLIVYLIFSLTIETTVQKSLIVFLTALVFGFILPIAMFVMMRKKKMISDNDAMIKDQRTLPYLIAIGFYSAGLIILIFTEVSKISIAFWFCYISNTIITIIINKYWKISAHSMGASGAAAALFFTFGWSSFVAMIITLLVGWSRMELKCHTASQVIAGILLAFASVYIQMKIITGL